MKIATATIHETNRRDSGLQLAHSIREQLGQRPIDLAILFVSAHFEDEVDRLAFEVHQHLGPRAMIGVTGEGVIAGAEEFESRPAVTLWAAHLPGGRVRTFHVSADELQALPGPEGLRELVGVPVDEMPTFVLMADPWSLDISRAIDAFQAAYPGRPAIGGLASAGDQRGLNRLVFEGQTFREGLCGAAIWGNVRIHTVVSQGCRPIGQHTVITAAERNVIRALGGRPALQAVAELLERCTETERELARARGLLVGRVINEHQATFQRGDFLIRNPLGFDERTGAMAINDYVRTGQTVQFHVRDAASARDDLDALLNATDCRLAAGALLFTCNGRGTRLFDEPSHDARVIAEACGRQPLAGFFCSGEIGPVAARNYLHGHTASMGFFFPAEPA